MTTAGRSWYGSKTKKTEDLVRRLDHLGADPVLLLQAAVRAETLYLEWERTAGKERSLADALDYLRWYFAERRKHTLGGKASAAVQVNPFLSETVADWLERRLASRGPDALDELADVMRAPVRQKRTFSTREDDLVQRVRFEVTRADLRALLPAVRAIDAEPEDSGRIYALLAGDELPRELLERIVTDEIRTSYAEALLAMIRKRVTERQAAAVLVLATRNRFDRTTVATAIRKADRLENTLLKRDRRSPATPDR